LYANELLRILYAPQKAVKEIVEKPKYIGPLFVIILLLVANVGFAYAAISKTYVEQTLPDGSKFDEWTENSTLWTSNAQIGESNDYVNGSYYGNTSISFSMTNGTEVSMQLLNIGPINCSGPDSFDNVSFRVKLTSPTAAPQDVVTHLFSAGSGDFFRSISGDFNSSTYNVWNNVSIQLGTGDWSSNSSSSDWSSITGLKLEFTWLDTSNITVLVDGLFFHGPFKSLLDTSASVYLLNYSLYSIMQFVITWVIMTGLIYLLTKWFGGKLVWKPLLVVVGIILMVLFIQAAVNAISYATLPKVYYPFDLIGGVSGEGTAAYDTILAQTWLISEVNTFMQIAVWIWIIGLCSVAVHLLAQFSWAKSVAVGAVAYLVTVLAQRFLLG
jgi:hypothetical protein